jgi:hypothetical protein
MQTRIYARASSKVGQQVQPTRTNKGTYSAAAEIFALNLENWALPAALRPVLSAEGWLTLQVVRPQLLQLLCHKLQYVLRDGPLILRDLLLTV